jgi:prolyl 4-hydroxylase
MTLKDRSTLNNLCRGNYNKAPKRLARLYCKFQKDSYFSKIAPLKVEEIHRNPTIVIFYDVISDNEITTIKGLVKKNVR